VGIANQTAKDEIKPNKNSYLDLLWNAVGARFEAAETLPSPSSNLESDIANFTPRLIRLKHPQIPAVLQHNKLAAAAPNLAPAKQASPVLTLNLAADCGSLAHLYMEMIANSNLSEWPTSRMDASAMQFWLLQRGHSKNEVEKQVPLIIDVLKQTITSPQGVWILAARASTQAELSITVIDENNEPQEQRIDLTFIDDDLSTKTKTRWIIDYKLGLDVTEANCEAAAQTHKPQLTGYAALFLHENLPIKTAVFFLSLGKLVEI
jgi:hypothetical protein